MSVIRTATAVISRPNAASSAIPVAVVAVAILVLPNVVSPLYLRLITLATIWFVAVLGLQLVLGQTGLVSLGHAAFVAVGAYAAALLTVRLGLSFWLSLPLAGLVAAAAALVVGIPTLKLRGHYLAIATLGVAQIVYMLLINLQPITNGADGITGIGRPLSGGVAYYYLTVAVAVLLAAFVTFVARSPFGLALRAIRTDELAAEVMGVEIASHRLLAFSLGAFCAGVAGVLYAHYEGFISPGGFTLSQSIVLLTMTVVGGTGSVLGSAIGAALVTILPEYLRFLGAYYLILYGLAMLVSVLFMPDGIAGLVIEVPKRLAAWIARGRGVERRP